MNGHQAKLQTWMRHFQDFAVKAQCHSEALRYGSAPNRPAVQVHMRMALLPLGISRATCNMLSGCTAAVARRRLELISIGI